MTDGRTLDEQPHTGTHDQILTWDAVDPFDPADQHYWVRLEHLGRYLFAIDHLRETTAIRVVDAGAGTGFGAQLMAEAGFDVTAIDLDAALVARYTNRPSIRLRGVVADLHQLRLDDIGEYVDTVTLFEVLEHLLDPDTALQALAACVRPGGTLVCSVPSRIWETRTHSGLPANRAHKTLFGRQEIITLVEHGGFAVRYVLGQGLCNHLMRREEELLKSGRQPSPLAGEPALNTRQRMLDLARLLGYPSTDYADWSYSHIVIATRTP